MSNKDNGGPAFPCEYVKYEVGEVGNNIPIIEKSSGMTLRDYFAAKAMVQIMDDTKDDVSFDYAEVAKYSYKVADAMLEERNAN